MIGNSETLKYLYVHSLEVNGCEAVCSLFDRAALRIRNTRNASGNCHAQRAVGKAVHTQKIK